MWCWVWSDQLSSRYFFSVSIFMASKLLRISVVWEILQQEMIEYGVRWNVLRAPFINSSSPFGIIFYVPLVNLCLSQLSNLSVISLELSVGIILTIYIFGKFCVINFDPEMIAPAMNDYAISVGLRSPHAPDSFLEMRGWGSIEIFNKFSSGAPSSEHVWTTGMFYKNFPIIIFSISFLS